MRMGEHFTDHVSELLGVGLIEHGSISQQTPEKSVLVEKLNMLSNVLVHSLLNVLVGEGVRVGTHDILDDKNDPVCHLNLLPALPIGAQAVEKLGTGISAQIGHVVEVGESVHG